MANPKIQALLEEFAGKLDRILKEEAVEMLRSQLLGSVSSGKVPAPESIAGAIARAATEAAKPAPKKRGRPRKTAAPLVKEPAFSKTIADLAPAKSAKKKPGTKPAAAPKASAPKKPTGGKRNRRSPADLDRDAGRLLLT